MREVLAAQRGAVLEDWLARALASYPEHAARFLRREADPFRNPVGHAFGEALPLLLDELLGEMDMAKVEPALDRLVQIRAVQDLSAAQAVGFVFALRPILRARLERGGAGAPDADGLLALEARIDRMALLAFDLYTKWRERLSEIKVNEARRRVALLARLRGAEASSEGAGGEGSGRESR